MKLIAAFCVISIGLVSSANAQEKRAADKPANLTLTTVGRQHHSIQTSNREAQDYFDQGITLLYGFNHEEAARSFQKAAELDPQSPMPLWGIAMAVGPNYNQDVDPEREKIASRRAGLRYDIDASLFQRGETRLQKTGEYLRDGHAHAVPKISGGSGRCDDVRGELDEFGSLEALDARRQARRAHGRDCARAGIGARAGSEPRRRESLLHPHARSLTESGTRIAQRATAGDARAKCRPFDSHACAHLRANWRFLPGGRAQCKSRTGRQGLCRRSEP